MRNNIIIVIACLLLVSLSHAYGLPGNSLKGVVRDDHGLPLQGVIINIPDIKAGIATDSSGSYFLPNLPKGRFLVVASLISYAKATAMISINGDAEQNFVLSETAIEAKEVVITGQSKATEIKRTPIPVAVINNQYLRTNVSSNIIDAIAKIPGVAAVSTGPNLSKPSIRGLGFNRVLTLYDGMKQEGQQWGEEHGVEVDEYSIDHIELVKGPSSLIYGSDALAGVVNLIPSLHATEGKTKGEITSEYQSNNNLLGISGMATGNNKGFYWLARISHKQAANYTNPVDGRVYGTSFNENDGSASFGLNRKWGNMNIGTSLFDDDQAVPDGSRDSLTRKFTKQISEADTFRPVVSDKELRNYTIPVVHQHVQHYRLYTTNSFNVFNGVVAFNAGFERNMRREFSHPGEPDIAGLYLQLNSYTYDVKYHLKTIQGWDITAGVNGMYQSNDVTQGTEFIIPSYHLFDVGPFALFKKNIGKVDISGGIRYDSRSFHNDALYTLADPVSGFDKPVSPGISGASKQFGSYDHTFSGFTYSLGLSYIVSKQLALKGNIARGFRAPNIAEISANGVHPGTNIYQLGNSDFKPEFSLQEDLGLSFTSRHLSVDLSVFNNDITNYIYNRKVLNSQGLDSVIVPGNQTFQFNASSARLYGAEADIDIHPHPLDWLHFENSISVVYARNKGVNGITPLDNEKYLPFIPPLHGVSELRASFKEPANYVRNTFVKVQVVAYARQDRVYLANNTETPTPGYTLFNAGLGTDIANRKGKVIFNVALFANNIFNTAYQDHLSRLKYFEDYPGDPRGHGIYNMGRNIGIKLFVPLNFR